MEPEFLHAILEKKHQQLREIGMTHVVIIGMDSRSSSVIFMGKSQNMLIQLGLSDLLRHRLEQRLLENLEDKAT